MKKVAALNFLVISLVRLVVKYRLKMNYYAIKPVICFIFCAPSNKNHFPIIYLLFLIGMTLITTIISCLQKRVASEKKAQKRLAQNFFLSQRSFQQA